MPHDDIRRKLWSREYNTLMGINMEFGNALPRVVRLFKEIVKQYSIEVHDILDVGCGKGRIGLHLALSGYNVIGMDFVRSALESFTAQSKELNVQDHVVTRECDLSQKWPLQDNSVDAVFSITVIENLIAKRNELTFRGEITRVLRSGGILVLEWYTPDDEYYCRLPKADKTLGENVMHDKKNNMTFKLFSSEEVMSMFGGEFTLLAKERSHFISRKYGGQYQRETEIMIMQYNPE